MNPEPDPDPLVINGPANDIGQTLPSEDVCLPVNDSFNPTAGLTRWTLQPCEIYVPIEPQLTSTSTPPSLPITGNAEVIAGAATVTIVLGIALLVASVIRLGKDTKIS